MLKISKCVERQWPVITRKQCVHRPLVRLAIPVAQPLFCVTYICLCRSFFVHFFFFSEIHVNVKNKKSNSKCKEQLREWMYVMFIVITFFHPLYCVLSFGRTFGCFLFFVFFLMLNKIILLILEWTLYLYQIYIRYFSPKYSAK